MSAVGSEVLEITLRTLAVCGTALALALCLGLPLGIALGRRPFPGRRPLVALVNSGMGAPPVVVGLGVALLLWRSGPLGGLGLMYSTTAMILAQVLIALPLVVGITLASVGALDEEWRLQVRSLGVPRRWRLLLLLREIRLGLLAAVIAALGGILSEVGAVMMVGGNLAGETRVLTTAILMHTQMGEFETALGLAAVLLGLMLVLAAALTAVQQAGRPVNQVALEARELRVQRRESGFALDVPQLLLHEGEVLVLLGPNGAGKSTLLRALAGVEAGATGRLSGPRAGAVALVFQRPIAFAGSVLHNARIGLLGRGLPQRDAQALAQEALERFGIAGLAERRAAALSGGELRRLALARAFAMRPAVLLLDEPFDDLDAAGQAALSLDLRRAIAQTRVAVAMVTHDLRRALLLADRLGVLIGGRLVQQGPRSEVLARPSSLSVARLVGMTNLVRAQIVRDGAGVCAEVDSQHRIPLTSDLPGGSRVHVGIRPEHLKLDVGRGEGESIGKGRVLSVVDDGVAASVSIEWAGQPLRTHLLAGRGLARTLAPGDPVSLSVRADHVHVLADTVGES